jgi:hypothetical protein
VWWSFIISFINMITKMLRIFSIVLKLRISSLLSFLILVLNNINRLLQIDLLWKSDIDSSQMQKKNWNQFFITSWKMNIKVPSKPIHKPKIKAKKWSPKLKEKEVPKVQKLTSSKKNFFHYSLILLFRLIITLFQTKQ